MPTATQTAQATHPTAIVAARRDPEVNAMTQKPGRPYPGHSRAAREAPRQLRRVR
jgi:hypothetical protein